MNDSHFLSVVIPVYNVSKYVREALLSLFRQTYNEFELIIVDDCGQDDSMQIVAKTIQEVQPSISIKIIHHEKNRGLSAARNTGILNASGEYIYFMDSDDELPSNSLMDLTNIARLYPGVQCVVGNIRTISRRGNEYEEQLDGKNFNHFPSFSNDRQWIVSSIFDYTTNHFIYSCAQNKLYLKSFLINNNLQFVEGLIHEDEKFVYDLSLFINCCGFCKDITYNSYVNPNSIMTTLDACNSASNWIKIIDSSYKQFEPEYMNLKMSYTLCEIKRLMYYIPSHKSCIIKHQLKDLIKNIRSFLIAQRYYSLSILTIILQVLPYKCRDFVLFRKAYNKIFRMTTLKKMLSF